MCAFSVSLNTFSSPRSSRGNGAPVVGPFNYPTQLVPAPSGDLYVSDGYRNARVHRFSPDGRLLASWGEPGKEGPSQFHLPHSVLVDEDGLVYVCDRENNRIQVFTGEGRFITMWTDLRRPLDISSNADGILHVSEGGVDGLSPRVSLLTKQGQVVAGGTPCRLTVVGLMPTAISTWPLARPCGWTSTLSRSNVLPVQLRSW